MDEKSNQMLSGQKAETPETPELQFITIRQKKILRLFCEQNKPLTAHDVTRLMPVHGYANLSSGLGGLARKGFTEALNTGRPIFYKITEKGKSVFNQPEKWQVNDSKSGSKRLISKIKGKKRRPYKKKDNSKPHKRPLPQNEPASPDMNLSINANQALDQFTALIQQNDQYRSLFEKIRNLINDELNN